MVTLSPVLFNQSNLDFNVSQIYVPKPDNFTLSSVKNTIPSYLYVQYADDDNLQSMVAAYNAYTQGYIDYLNYLSLPIYTGLSGPLLDWVGTNLYGFPRPSNSSTGTGPRGPYDTVTTDSWPFNQFKRPTQQLTAFTSDDVYQRCLTWLFFRGDGTVPSIDWLKRRIKRFIIGANGTAPNIDNTYEVSAVYAGTSTIHITVAKTLITIIMKSMIGAGVLQLPFNLKYVITLT